MPPPPPSVGRSCGVWVFLRLVVWPEAVQGEGVCISTLPCSQHASFGCAAVLAGLKLAWGTSHRAVPCGHWCLVLLLHLGLVSWYRISSGNRIFLRFRTFQGFVCNHSVIRGNAVASSIPVTGWEELLE